METSPCNVGFGSKRDLTAPKCDFCYTPESGLVRSGQGVPTPQRTMVAVSRERFVPNCPAIVHNGTEGSVVKMFEV